MKMEKKYDISVVVSEYTDSNGELKKRYKRVGSLMEGEYGPFIFLDPTFNPAGVMREPGKDVFLSLFKPEVKVGSGTGTGRTEPLDDEIKF